MASKTSKRLQQLDRKNQSRSQQRSQPLTSRFTPTTVEDPAASWAAFVAGMVVLVLLVMVLAVLMGFDGEPPETESGRRIPTFRYPAQAARALGAGDPAAESSAGASGLSRTAGGLVGSA